MKVLGVVLDRHLPFHKHDLIICIRHVGRLLSTELAQTLASVPSVTEIPRQAFTAPAAFVVIPAADYIQVGSSYGACPHRFTYTTESWNVSAAELYAHLPSRCWTNRSLGQTFPGVLSDFQHRLLELAATNSNCSVPISDSLF